jgi:hypothetical protein
MKIEELTARWTTGEIPAKGVLIDESGCMCAQGQVLHYCGGWSKDRLAEVNQLEADRAVAKLLGISLTHAVLLRQVNDWEDGKPADVLTAPEKILGSQAATVLAFWRYLDTLTREQLQAAGVLYWKFRATVAACEAAGPEAYCATLETVSGWAAASAAAEIQGAEFLRQQGREFYFLPRFDFTSPEAVLAKP